MGTDSADRGQLTLLHSGKVRDVYRDGPDLILLASDRVSVYDVILPTEIPEKGAMTPLLAAFMPNVLFGLAGYYLLIRAPK